MRVVFIVDNLVKGNKMTKRITLVFDLLDDDVKQVDDMITDVLATFSGEVFLFQIRNPTEKMDDVFLESPDLLPADIIEVLQDKVTCELVADWSKNLIEHNMKNLIDTGILVDFLTDHLMDEMLRR